MRSDCAERAAALCLVRPPIPRAFGIGARIRAKCKGHVTHLAYVAATNQFARFQPARKKAQLMIDQCEHAGFPRSLVHATRFFGIHRHWLFTKNRLATIERSQSYLAMRDHRRDDANQIDVVASDERAPITLDARYAEL